MAAEYFTKIEQEKAQASVFLIKVDSIHHINNYQTINVHNFSWIP